VLEALLLAAVAWVGLHRRTSPASGGRLGLGFGLLVLAIVGYPWLGVLLGRPLSQAEVFGIAPDPTAVGTLGVLLLTASGRHSAARRRAVVWRGRFRSSGAGSAGRPSGRWTRPRHRCCPRSP
jgi:hypothetical protein